MYYLEIPESIKKHIHVFLQYLLFLGEENSTRYSIAVLSKNRMKSKRIYTKEVIWYPLLALFVRCFARRLFPRRQVRARRFVASLNGRKWKDAPYDFTTAKIRHNGRRRWIFIEVVYESRGVVVDPIGENALRRRDRSALHYYFHVPNALWQRALP